MKPLVRRIAWVGGAAALVAAVLVARRAAPVSVETGMVDRGPLAETVDEKGETRVRFRHLVTAPAAGRLVPVRLEAGDSVRAGQVLARLFAAPLDPRARMELDARMRSAAAARDEANARHDQAAAAFAEARRSRDRVEQLAASRGSLVSPEELDRVRTAARSREVELDAAQHRAEAAAWDVAAARAALQGGGSGIERELPLRAPISGRVLRVLERNERTVAAGEPVVELADLADLEIVIEVLSADAVRIRPGAAMRLTAGGDSGWLDARVRLVEPSGFRKVSPLGVEEQRVNVLADLVSPRGSIGDHYRVDARIVVWEAGEVLRVPSRALFRDATGWAVFTAADGRARLVRVAIGHRGGEAAEVRSGLAAGDTVVLQPGDLVRDGARVTVLSTSPPAAGPR